VSSAATSVNRGYRRSNDNFRVPTANAFARPVTREQRVEVSSTQRFIPVIHELETKRLLDEQTVSLLKTLVLEENFEV
jgi:hypothetical protein